MQCEFCEKNILKSGCCPDCGNTIYTADGSIIYGPTAKDICDCEMAITEKFLIIRRISKKERRGDVLSRGVGLIGVLVNEAAKSGKKRDYGFYSLNQIEKAIFPYRTDSIKRKNAIKLINKDGTEFILVFDKAGMDGIPKIIKKMVSYISASIPLVENGEDKNFGHVHCSNPYVTYDNFDQIRPVYSTAHVSETNTEKKTAHYTYQSVSESTKPVVESTTIVEPKPVITPEPITEAKPVVKPDHVKAPETLICTNCSAKVAPGSNFCNMCGSKIELIKKCKNCGKILDDIDRFCSNCGTPAK